MTQHMTVEEYRIAVGAPPKREARAVAKALPEPTPQELVKMVAAKWPAAKRVAVELPEPPSLNNAYENTGGNGRRKSKKLVEFYAQATGLLSQLGQRLDADTYRAHILVTRTNARADIDGKAKFILDVLGKCGITPDDRNCEKVTIEWRYRGEPGASIVLDRYSKRRAA
jgi:Holliday junction resolvase RusA-like endonuclease